MSVMEFIAVLLVCSVPAMLAVWFLVVVARPKHQPPCHCEPESQLRMRPPGPVSWVAHDRYATSMATRDVYLKPQKLPADGFPDA